MEEQEAEEKLTIGPTDTELAATVYKAQRLLNAAKRQANSAGLTVTFEVESVDYGDLRDSWVSVKVERIVSF